jgi:hypothetical protein
MNSNLSRDRITPTQLREIELKGGFHANVPLHLTRMCLYAVYYDEETIIKRGGSSRSWSWGIRSHMQGVYL